MKDFSKKSILIWIVGFIVLTIIVFINYVRDEKQVFAYQNRIAQIDSQIKMTQAESERVSRSNAHLTNENINSKDVVSQVTQNNETLARYIATLRSRLKDLRDTIKYRQ